MFANARKDHLIPLKMVGFDVPWTEILDVLTSHAQFLFMDNV